MASALTGCDDLKGLKQKRKTNHKCVCGPTALLGVFKGPLPGKRDCASRTCGHQNVGKSDQ